MDLQMPEGNGVAATRDIARGSPRVRVLMVTLFEDDASVFAALRAGARGYMLKDADEREFIERAHKSVWCTVATVDSHNRPRSRLLHPIWEGATGWIATYRTSLKAKHLAANSYVSLAYVADVWNPVYVDCVTEWDDSPHSKQRVWHLFLSAPPPLGYDPTPTFHRVDHPDYGVLKLRPWRITLADTPATHRVWTRAAE